MSFDAIAPHYRWMEWVTAGSLLQRCRTQFIHEMQSARNILLLGEGRGRFLFELLRQNHSGRVTCLDASARMLQLMQTDLPKRQLSPHAASSSSFSSFSFSSSSSKTPTEHKPLPQGRPSAPRHSRTNTVQFLHTDILREDWPRASEPYDAIASHFFLDCFRPDQVVRVCEKVAASAASRACWLISDFCEPESGWRRIRARWILALMYGFFRVATRLPAKRLTVPDPCLESVGFRLRDRRCYNQGLLHSDLWVKA